MKFAAVHYVSVGKRMYTPGEVIDQPLDDAQIAHLCEKKAIRPIGEIPVTYVNIPETPKINSDRKKEATEEETKKEAKEETEGVTEDAAEAIDADAELIEIDAADGIVAAEEPVTKAKRTRRAKK